MYQIIKKGTEYDLFTEGIINSLFATVQKEIIEMLKSIEKPKPAILGAFALKNVPLKNGENTNVWIEFNAKILPNRIVDAGIHQCIIYDEIPDIILDKYNDMKTMVFNN
jgi:hypothetical protein